MPRHPFGRAESLPGEAAEQAVLLPNSPGAVRKRAIRRWKNLRFLAMMQRWPVPDEADTGRVAFR
jgi:hypothetical protein